MQLDAREHFKEIVGPAISEYEQAEDELTEAVQAGNEARIHEARFRALRRGGTAIIFLHHFADVIAKRPPEGLPDFDGKISNVHQYLREHGASDIALLGDTADALKHSALTRRLPRQVEAVEQVVTVGRGYGIGRYGEGKFGGTEQVWILARSGQRALTSVLRDIRSAWENILKPS